MRANRIVPLAACLAVLSVACAPGTRPAPPGSQCTYASDCAAGQLCGAGKCVAQCAADRDCSGAQVCATGGRCQLPAGRCLRDADCGTGQACSATGSCGKVCQSSAACGTGFVCLSNVCLAVEPQCIADVDCGAGKKCATNGTCSFACTTATDCPSGQTCSGGACVVAPVACANSTQCTAPQVCKSGQCVSQCAADQDCGANQRCNVGVCQALPPTCLRTSDCPSGKACIAGSCADQCVSNRDCLAGYACTSGSCTVAPPQCLASTDCTSGQVCSPGGACVASCTSSTTCASTETCSNGGCVPTGAAYGSISGSATYTGLASQGGIQVTLRGPNNASATTTSAGAYGFAGLAPGVYTLHLVAPFSAEGSQDLEIIVHAGVVATPPAAVFTPVGQVKGTAVLSDKGAVINIQVFVAGTGRGASTDASGNFTVLGVPPGSQQVIATYPGYTAASASVTIAFGTVANAGTLSLTPVPAQTGSSFAFTTTAPTTARFNTSYSYTAQASGGGASGVTYSIEAGPPGMTIDPASGAVSFNPTPASVSPGTYLVAIAAHAGSIVYQVFSLNLPPLYTELSGSFSGLRDLDTANGVVWGSGNNRVDRFGASHQTFFESDDELSGTIGSMSLANGGNITAIKPSGGTVTSLTGPFGALNENIPGGTATSWTPADSAVVASERFPGGTIAAVKAQGGDTVTTATYPSAKATSFSASFTAPTSVSTTVGTVSALTATQLTDTAGAWTTAVIGQCITNATASNFLQITSVPDSTHLGVSNGDLTQLLQVGHLYFVANCNGTLPFRLHHTGTDFSTLYGRSVDLYLDGRFLAGDLVGNSISTADFSFNAPVSLYQSMLLLPTRGGYLIADSGGGMIVHLTDSSAAFGNLTAATNYVAFNAAGTAWQIVANTATTLDFRVSPRTPIEQFVAGLSYSITTDAGGRVPITVGLTTGGLTASALVGQYLFVDSEGASFQISANTASSITVLAVPGQLRSLPDWTGRAVAPTPSANASPTFIATDTAGGLTPNALTGLALLQRVSSSPPWVLQGTISANTATQITYANAGNCYSSYGNCLSLIASTVASFTGAVWGVSQPFSYGYVPYARFRFTVTAQGTPGWAIDALAGQTVALLRAPTASAVVISNDASSLLLEANVNSFEILRALVAGDKLILSENGGTGSARYRITITDATAAFTPNLWTGATVLLGDGTALGGVLGNGVGTVDVSLADPTLLSRLTGARYAFSGPGPTPRCTGEVDATVTLTGAVLMPASYFVLTTSSYDTYAVFGNDASTAQVALCPHDLSRFLSASGSTAVLSPNGTFTATLTDTAASFTPGALTGGFLHSVNSYNSIPIAGNGAQTVAVQLAAYSLYQLSPYGAGQPYVVTDANDTMTLRVATDQPLTANALQNRFVFLDQQNFYSGTTMLVSSNDASSVLFRLGWGTFRTLGASSFDRLRTSAGAVLRIHDPGSAYTAGTLKGRTVLIGGYYPFVVMDNTATDLIVATSDPYALDVVRGSSSYLLPGTFSGQQRMLALPTGDAWAGRTGVSAQVVRVSTTGVAERHLPLTAATALTATPSPLLAGTWTGLSTAGGFATLTDSTATWTTGQWKGAQLTLQPYAGGWYTFPVVANTATTLTVYDPQGVISAGWLKPYVLDPHRLVVSGTTLTAGALRGARIWIEGSVWRARDNDASSILLHRRAPYYTPEPPHIQTGGGTAWVLGALDGAAVGGLALDANGTLWAATQYGLAALTAGTWSSFGEEQTSGVLATDTVATFDATSVTATTGGFTANAFAGKRLRLGSGIYSIASNTANQIVLVASSTFGPQEPPALGETFQVLDGLGLTTAADVAAAGTTIWVATDNGLVRRPAGSAIWNRLTVASTESAPGKADGLPSNFVHSVGVGSNGTDLWVATSASGVARLVNTTWTQFSVASTQTAPGLANGLPNDSIADFAFRGSDVWFASQSGPAKLNGSTWTQPNFSFTPVSRDCRDVALPGATDTWFATSDGLWHPTP